MTIKTKGNPALPAGKFLTKDNPSLPTGYLRDYSNVSPPLDNLVMWYKADAITGVSDGDTITQWPDSSGNANDLTSVSGSPIYNASDPSFNNKPTVSFNYQTVSLSNPPVMPSPVNTTVYVVAMMEWTPSNYNTNGIDEIFGWGRDSATNFQVVSVAYFSGAGAGLGRYSRVDASTWSPNGGFQKVMPNVPFIFSFSQIQDSAIACNPSYLNGNVSDAKCTSNTPPQTVLGGTSADDGIVIGGGLDGGPVSSFVGKVAEILVYDDVTPHSDFSPTYTSNPAGITKRKRIERYLSLKYGIKLGRPASSLVSEGLVVHLDAANPASYPGTGTTWFDLSGNSKHATFVGSPTWNSTGYFTGWSVSNYMTISSTPYDVIPTGTADRTVIACYRSGNAGSAINHIFNYGSVTPQLGFGIGTNNRTLLVQPSQSLSTRAGSYSSVNDNMNRTVAVRYKNSNLTGEKHAFMVHGLIQRTTSDAAINTVTTANPRIGVAVDGTNPLHPDSRLYALYIYDRALSDAELLQMWHYLKPRTPNLQPGYETDNRPSARLDCSTLRSVGDYVFTRGRITASSLPAVKRGATYEAEYVTLLNIPATATYQIDLISDSDPNEPTITTTSSAWDTYLTLIDQSYIDYSANPSQVLATSDDEGPDKDSSISTTLQRGGTYICECTPFSATPPATGYFKLKVTRIS